MSDRSLHANNGKTWQSLEQLAGDTPETGEFSNGGGASTLADSSISRRGFMGIMSASMALTAAACRRPIQKLVPVVESHQVGIPGLPVDYTSVYQQQNVAYGALVKSREGRPIKVKGNDLHPVNSGKTSAAMQASLLSLYDPDRMRRPRVRMGGGATSYNNAVQKLSEAVTAAQDAGKNAVVVIDEHCSPSYDAMMKEISAAIPAMQFVTMPAIITDSEAIANKAVLGIDGEIAPDLSKAKVIVCVDADPLGSDKLALYNTAGYAAKRKPTHADPMMSTLIVAEAQYSLTGANADVRNKLHPSQIEAYLAVVEQTVVGGAAIGGDIASNADDNTMSVAKRAAEALQTAQGEALVLAGRHLSPKAHAIALSINEALGAIGAGKPLDPSRVVPFSGASSSGVASLVNDLNAGMVHTLIFCDVNAEYAQSRAFKEAMLKADVRASISLYEDETAAKSCDISIPGSHWLESWGDAVSIDGTMSVQQPLIAPMNDGILSTEDTLMMVAKTVNSDVMADYESYYDYVVGRWSTAGDWNKILQDGVVTAMPPMVDEGGEITTSAMPAGAVTVNRAAAMDLDAPSVDSGTAVMVTPAIGLYDGAQGNNAWLQEMPDPVTKITWDNVAMMSASTALGLGLAESNEPKKLAKANGAVVTVSTESGSIDVPVWVQPGMADDVVSIALGYGRTNAGQVGNGVGVNAYLIADPYSTTAYQAGTVEKADVERIKIACVQDHHTLDDGSGERPVAKRVTIGDIEQNNLGSLGEHFPNAGKDETFLQPLSIVNDYEYKGHRWGMVIDMSSCTGCSSCIVACQSENNIPSVGKDQILVGREMHWIRLDRYYTGDMEDPATVHEPMLCQHCENAPCENVCPVAATTHSPEGLNEMTYNRCVGTRYCLNNCPYKVRRFNFLNYNEEQRSPLDLAFNPDVTVRFRGVMEKCTFCVQRLHDAKWQARDAGRARVNDGEAVTACQEACPASAIIFGDTNDPNSQVSKARYGERSFRVLSELNVRPQVTYLAKVKNVDGLTEAHGPAHSSEEHGADEH